MSFRIKQYTDEYGKVGYELKMTRGDYAAFSVIPKVNGEAYELQEGDEFLFTVKKSTKTAEVLFQKTSTAVEIEHEDTAELKYGTYTYDCQLTLANGRPFTFIGPCDFILTGEVSW